MPVFLSTNISNILYNSGNNLFCFLHYYADLLLLLVTLYADLLLLHVALYADCCCVLPYMLMIILLLFFILFSDADVLKQHFFVFCLRLRTVNTD